MDEPPVFSASTAISYAENRDSLAANYSPVDPERKAVTLRMAGMDSDRFELVPAGRTTQLHFKEPPDYEVPGDDNRDNDYLVTVIASDGTRTSSHHLILTVVDVNERPVVTGDTSPMYAEGGTDAVEVYTANDPEGDSITWLLSGNDSADFFLRDGVLSFREPPDHESPVDADMNNEYLLRITAFDESLGGRVDIKVTVTGTNEEPAFPGTWTPSSALARTRRRA